MKIQQRFLWEGVKGEFKIIWVRWVDVCKPKKLGGLSICNLHLFNFSLLGKWRWHLISGASGLWLDLLSPRYGVILSSSTMGGRTDFLQ